MIKNCYNEILLLKKRMDDANIPYYFEEYMNGYRLAYPNNNDVKCSVIEHDGSYGRHEDLLEIMGLLTEEEEKYDCVLGSLTSSNVFSRIQKDYLAQLKP